MNRLYTTALAMATFAFVSCKKTSTETAAPDPAQPDVALKLRKMTVTENGAVKVLNFSYDNEGLLSGFAATDNSEHSSFAYDNNKNLVAVDETEAGFHNVYTYTYNNGKPVSAQFKSWKIMAGMPNQLWEDDVLTYTVTGDRVTGIHLEMLQDATESDFVLTYNSAGDVTQIRTVGSNNYQADFAYGSHKSPFPVITKWVLDHAGFSLHYYTRRDLLSVSYDFPGTMFDRTQATTYTYNAAGYPATATSGNVHTVFEY